MSWVPFVPTPPEVVRKMLELAGVKEGDLVFDLGCGDGRILVTAAKDFGARAIGVEIREDLAEVARKELRSLSLENRCRVINGNFFEVDISRADVVTLYLTSVANYRLKPKLEKELKDGARVVSHDFEMAGWKPEAVIHDPGGHVIYLYRVERKSLPWVVLKE